MTSLSMILDADDDDKSPVKKDRLSQGDRRYGAAHHPSTSAISTQPDSASSSTLDQSPSGGSSRTRQSCKESLATTTSSPTSTTPFRIQTSSPYQQEQSQQQLLQAPEMMDRSGYSHLGGTANAAMRIRGLTGGQLPVKLTPITGRVSRAKKGVPVHVCEICKPPKTFTRAEHLRRHQLSHDKPRFVCQYPGCEKVFHRSDLLRRHQQRHDTEGDGASAKTPNSRRTSVSSSTGQAGPASPYPPAYTAPTGKSPSTPLSPPEQSPGFTQGVLQPPSTSYQPPPTTTEYSTTSAPAMDYTRYPTTPANNAPAEAPYQPVSTSADPSRSSSDAVLRAPTRTWEAAPPQTMYPTGIYGPSPYGYPQQMSYPCGGSLGHEARIGDGGYSDFSTPMAPSMVFIKLTLTQASHLVVSSPTVSSPSATGILSGYANPAGQTLSPSSNPLASDVFDPWSSSSTSSLLSATLSTGPLQVPQADLFSVGREWDTEGMHAASLAPPQMMPSISEIAAPCLQPRAIQQPSMMNLREYLDVYFEKVAPKIPIVHVSTAFWGQDRCKEVNFMGTPDESKIRVLQSAMAAVASQFMPGREARVRGDRMHKWALNEVKTSLELSNLKVRQAIILCEYYSRFRGCKAAIQPSGEFEWVYRQLLEEVKSQNLLQARQAMTFSQWLDLETRRRLLSACFLLDVHSSTLYAQEALASRFLNVKEGHSLPIPLTRQTAQLWKCPDEKTWKSCVDHDLQMFRASKDAPEQLPSIGTIPQSRAEEIGRLPFDNCLISAAEAFALCPKPNSSSNVVIPPWYPSLGQQGHAENLSSGQSSVSLSPSVSQSTIGTDDELEDQEEPANPVEVTQHLAQMEQLASKAPEHLLFPSNPTSLAYAALRVTPLLPLLAVSGETWIFAQKITSKHTFVSHKRRLQAWVISRACVIAAKWAARALLKFIGDGPGWQESCTEDISAYWIVYICVLILWAFGHRGAATGVVVEGETTVFAWLQRVGEMKEDTDALRQRSLSDGLVRAARKRLAVECGNGLNKLLIDAERVLGKLADERGAEKIWF